MAMTPLFQSGASQTKPFQLNMGGGGIGITPQGGNQGMSPALTSSQVPMGIKALNPVAYKTSPSTAIPSNQAVSPGTYKGISINPGSDAQIQAQMQAIDAKQNTQQNFPSNYTYPTFGGNQNTPPPPQSTLPPSQSPTFPGLISSLSQRAGQPSSSYNVAQQQYDEANTALSALRQQEAIQGANIAGSRTNLAEAGGEQGILQNLFANKQAALTGEMTAAQSAAQTATAQQQAEQSGLAQAGGMLAPTLGQYGQAQYSPLGGTVGGGTGAGISPSDPFYATMQTYANQLVNNQGSSIPSSITGNPALQAQLLQMAQQINPSFNFNQASGIGSAQQQVAQTAGTAGQSAAQGVFNQSYSDFNTLQNATQNIDQFSNLLTQTMQQGGINPGDVKIGNETLSAIRNQLSSSQQAVYDNTLASLRSRVSGLLAAGGSEVPTAITADAQKILDGSLPLSSLNAVLGRIQQEGQVLLNSKAQIVNQNWSKIQSNGTTDSNTTQPNPWK